MGTCTTETSQAAASYTGKDCEEVGIVVSDLHVSEGGVFRVEKRLPWYRNLVRWVVSRFADVEPLAEVEETNPLEDFPNDRIFADFLKLMGSRYCDAKVLHLRLLGDVFDFLAVRWYGRFDDPPYETAALWKMRKILRGHPALFDALAEFAALPNTRISFYVGNHDQHVAWPRIQTLLRRRIARGDRKASESIRFIDQRLKFMTTERRVHYYHGMNAEPQNTINPRTCILKHRFGIPLKQPILNMPLASYMTTGIVNRIKLKNPLTGRLYSYSDVWKNAALHRWGWGLYAGFLVLWYFIYFQFFAFWNIRRKTSIKVTWDIVANTFLNKGVDEFAMRYLREHEDVDVIITGHTHEWKRVSSEDGTYINTGAWALHYELIEPKFEYRWKRFRLVETAWRGLLHFLSTGKIRFAGQLTKVIGYFAIVCAMVVYLFLSFSPEGWEGWALTPSDIKIFVGIALVFTVASGIIKLFAAKPEVERSFKLTFARVRHYRNGGTRAELMEYLPESNETRECMS